MPGITVFSERVPISWGLLSGRAVLARQHVRRGGSSLAHVGPVRERRPRTRGRAARDQEDDAPHAPPLEQGRGHAPQAAASVVEGEDDRALGGGLPRGRITEFFGGSSGGTPSAARTRSGAIMGEVSAGGEAIAAERTPSRRPKPSHSVRKQAERS